MVSIVHQVTTNYVRRLMTCCNSAFGMYSKRLYKISPLPTDHVTGIDVTVQHVSTTKHDYTDA